MCGWASRSSSTSSLQSCSRSSSVVPSRFPIAGRLVGGDLAPIAHVRHPVRRVDDNRVPARLQDPSPQVALARPVAADAGILAEGVDHPGDLGAEAFTELVELDVGVLDDVVQIGGRDGLS